MCRQILRAWLFRAGSARILIALCAAMLIAVGRAGAAAPALDPAIADFIDELVASDRFDRRQLRRWFAQTRVQPGILKAMAHPSTALPWHAFRTRHVTQARIRGGLEYWERNAGVLARASEEHGVAEELIVATIGIETFYGRVTGTSKVFSALVTLAFYYPPRAGLFRDELKQFLLLARELQFDPLQPTGSYAGALGVPQFLPSSYRRYAVDFDRNGRRDLWNHDDAIGSVANYYKNYGWRSGEPVVAAIEQHSDEPADEFKLLLERGIKPHTTVAAITRTGVTSATPAADDMPAAVFGAETEAGVRYWIGFNNFYVITRYNRSVNYALAVHELAQELRRLRGDGRAR